MTGTEETNRDPKGRLNGKGTGAASGSQGKVEASASGPLGYGPVFTASFTGGTISGNMLVGTLTFNYECQGVTTDAPNVKKITLTK